MSNQIKMKMDFMDLKYHFEFVGKFSQIDVIYDTVALLMEIDQL